MLIKLPTHPLAVFFGPDGSVVDGKLDVAAAAERGSFKVSARPMGFWSDDAISIRVSLDYFSHGDDKLTWKFTASHSSGGRDTEIPDDLEAELNFATAILVLNRWARETLREPEVINEMTRAFKAHCAKVEENQRRVKEHQAALVAADAPLGEEGAQKLIREARELLKTRQRKLVFIKVFQRGGERQRSVVQAAWTSAGIKWRNVFTRPEKEEDIKTFLSTMSHRTHVDK